MGYSIEKYSYSLESKKRLPCMSIFISISVSFVRNENAGWTSFVRYRNLEYGRSIQTSWLETVGNDRSIEGRKVFLYRSGISLWEGRRMDGSENENRIEYVYRRDSPLSFLNLLRQMRKISSPCVDSFSMLSFFSSPVKSKSNTKYSSRRLVKAFSTSLNTLPYMCSFTPNPRILILNDYF